MLTANQRPTQKQRLLRILKARGLNGVTNLELNEQIGFRFSARIYELRQDGFDIQRRHVLGGKWLFWLDPEFEHGED